MVKAAAIDSQELLDFGAVLRGRRTINLYRQTPVPKQLVIDAIEAATWAPNHHVTEPWRFYLLGSKTIGACLDIVRDITTAKKDARAGEAKAKKWSEKPGWLVVTCRKSADELRQSEDLAACAAAAQNLMLYLWKAGVGSKWTTGAITRDPRFRAVVGIEDEVEIVVGMFWYGYPQKTPVQRRTDVADTLVELP